MKLEDELGAKLFNRKGVEIGLTNFGEAFLPKAIAILGQLQEAEREIRDLVETESGHVTLGVSLTLSPYFLPRLLAGFLKPVSYTHLDGHVPRRLPDTQNIRITQR